VNREVAKQNCRCEAGPLLQGVDVILTSIKANAVPLDEIAASSPVQSHISTCAWQDDKSPLARREI
jgi:hypothetical protein